jgi:GntR family transcriptional regulator
MKVPKYYLVKGRIAELVDAAGPGAAIPTERELAERFATSRTTVRQALTELVVEGRLERTQGRGTFVAEPKLVQLRQLTSFSEDLSRQGRRATSQVLDIRRERCDAALAERLGVSAGTTVHRVERLRGQDDDPIAHEVAYLTPSLPRLAAQLATYGSLYATLRQAYDVALARVEDTVETALAGPDEARLLGVDVGLPMLLVHRTGWDAAGVVIEWTRSMFRGDRFRFVARSELEPSAS